MSRLTIKGYDRTNKKPCHVLTMPVSEVKITLEDIIEKLAYYEDLEEQGLLLELPCKVGDELYRITYPYRQPAKVTKYRVKNFRTIKRGQKLQLEVQADCVPARNWMYFKDFYTSREEAEKALAELGGKA